MKPQFLCARHRQQLSSTPNLAIHYWQESYDRGKVSIGRELWDKALPHAGLAFESSEIIMNTHAVNLRWACEMFASSAKMLADTYAQLGMELQKQKAMTYAIERLEKELTGTQDKQPWVANQLFELYQYLELHELRGQAVH